MICSQAQVPNLERGGYYGIQIGGNYAPCFSQIGETNVSIISQEICLSDILCFATKKPTPSIPAHEVYESSFSKPKNHEAKASNVLI